MVRPWNNLMHTNLQPIPKRFLPYRRHHKYFYRSHSFPQKLYHLYLRCNWQKTYQSHHPKDKCVCQFRELLSPIQLLWAGGHLSIQGSRSPPYTNQLILQDNFRKSGLPKYSSRVEEPV